MKKDIEILKETKGYTTDRAIRSLNDGTVIVDEATIQSFLDEWNSVAYDEDDMITVQQIEDGVTRDIDAVIYNGEKYYIFNAL